MNKIINKKYYSDGCIGTNKTKRTSKWTVLSLSSLCLLYIVALDLTSPSDAFAWGPGFHMVTANWILQNLSILPAACATALSLFPNEYRHGCLSADIFLGKGSVTHEGHSHSWPIGLALLQKSHTKRRQAFAYGYLSHLSADTVAHNVFVPETSKTAPGVGRFAHVYIEMQADRMLKWSSQRARKTFVSGGAKSAERMLRDEVGHKATAFWLKKHIFKGSIIIGGNRGLRGAMHVMDSVFPHARRDALLDEMLRASCRAVFDVLINLDKSPVTTLDPVGTDALAAMEDGMMGRTIFKSVTAKLKTLMPFHSKNNDELSFDTFELALPDALASLPKYPMPESFLQ